MFKEFDASSEEHVMWLKSVIDEKDPTSKMKLIEKNPMGQNVPPFELVQVLFGLSMKYTQAVFKGTAFIPKA
jgi:hypothetical protein